MSQTVAASLPIGPVQAYWNNVRLGSPMSQANFRHSKETVEYGLPDSGVKVGSHKTGEQAFVDITIADFKPSQLQYVYDHVADLDDPDTIDPNTYESGGSTIIRFREEVKLTSTTPVTLDQAGFITSTIKVYKSDLSNAPGGYTQGTDFTATASTGNVARVSAGAITSGDTVIVEYDHTSTAAIVYGGGGLTGFEAELKLVHELDGNGKFLQLKLYRAKKMGASDVAIQMAAEFGGVAMTFVALADMTKAAGKQLFEWAVEA